MRPQILVSPGARCLSAEATEFASGRVGGIVAVLETASASGKTGQQYESRGLKRSEHMVRRVLLVLGVLLATGILASGCYDSKRYVLETADWTRVILLDDDGLGSVDDIK